MASETPTQLHSSTVAIHADDIVSDYKASIAPPLHLSTIYDLGSNADAKLFYSRDDTPLRRRVEAVLGALEDGHAIIYSSGQSAAYAALRYFRPKRVFMTKGYHGTRQIVDRLKSEGTLVLNYEDALTANDLCSSDVIFLETPRNPTLELQDIAEFARITRPKGAILIVDSTLASPALQKPLSLGADVVYHSCTKYLGGHSDLLAGVLVVRDASVAEGLRKERNIMGSVPGAMESWLLLRSLRTLPLRMRKHSENASAIAHFLAAQIDLVEHVFHTSLSARLTPTQQPLETQMSGHTGVVTVIFRKELHAKNLASMLHLFRDATSLGGVESLLDWRKRWDPTMPAGLVRFSIGCEDHADLIRDLDQAFQRLRTTQSKL